MAQTARSRYEHMKRKRDPYLRRARDCAALTIPALMPPEGHNEFAILPEPYQGLGARATVSLASRLMVAMYPPGKPSFKLDVPPEARIQSGEMALSPEIEQGLVLSEKLIGSEIERKQWRRSTNLALQYLLVTGNVLEFMQPDNSIRLYRLDQYCVARDMQGDVREIITEEYLAPEALPEEAKSMVSEEEFTNNRVPLYTHVKRTKKGTYEVYQEINSKVVPKSKGEYLVMPYNALRYTAVISEDYGRGKIEEHLPDLRTIDALSKSLIDGAAMASRNVTMIRPNAAGGINLRRRIAKADNGDIIVGNPEDVSMLQFQNNNGMQLCAAELERQTREVSQAFLMGAATVRNSERTTAYEVQRMTEELEATLGGVYSQLNQDMQQARLRRLISQMKNNQQLPAWADGLVEPVILTGMEALGREQDVNRVQVALQFLQGMSPDMMQHIKMDVLLSKAFHGLNLPDAVRSPQELQAEQQRQVQQQAQMSMAQSGGAAGGEMMAAAAAQAMAQQGGGMPPQQ
jgi:ribosomal protein L39E